MSAESQSESLRQVAGSVRSVSEAVAEALADLEGAVQSESPACAKINGDDVIVYVLTPGLLHRLRGRKDSFERPSAKHPRESRCDYSVAAITRHPRWSLSVSVTNYGEQSRTIERAWEFWLGYEGETEPLQLGARPGETEFARALAKAITASRREPSPM
jgi:hypothetical protein